MIKQIILKNNNKFINNEIVIDFDPHINVIIGPKGGGKSTLFFLLAGLKNQTMYDIVKNAFKEYGFEFVRASTFGGDIIKANNLSLKKIKSSAKSDFDERNDVIYQDDSIKKELINSDSIKKDKITYIEKQIAKAKQFSLFVDDLKLLHSEMEDLYRRNDPKNEKINWSMLFEIQNLKSSKELDIILNINYNKNETIPKIKNELNEWLKTIEEIENFNISLEVKRKIKSLNLIRDEVFEKSVDEQISKNIKENKIIIDLINKRINILKRYKKIIDSFASAYDNTKEKIKAENNKITPIQYFVNQSKNHFSKMGKLLKSIIDKFEKIRTFDENFIIENDQEQENNKMMFEIPNEIKFSEEEIIKVLNNVFYKGDSLSDTRKWLEKLLEKGVKEFNEMKIKNSFASILAEKTKVLVDGKDYETLSLGQKSIYGLKYKFNKSKNDNLFMDQPEDNLDNNTIATEVLPLINKKEKQLFIVTHNANIGILSNPERIIVCDLNNKEQPYKSINFKNEINNESANFLEGGKQYLEERFNKIMKGE